MTFMRNIAALAILGAAPVLGGEPALAGDALPVQTMKPLHGISFDVGPQHAVSYFLNEDGRCNLVLTLAEEPNWEGPPNHTVTRLEAAIAPGKATRYNPAQGPDIEFRCQAYAAAMDVRPVERVAIEPGQ